LERDTDGVEGADDSYPEEKEDGGDEERDGAYTKAEVEVGLELDVKELGPEPELPAVELEESLVNLEVRVSLEWILHSASGVMDSGSMASGWRRLNACRRSVNIWSMRQLGAYFDSISQNVPRDTLITNRTLREMLHFAVVHTFFDDVPSWIGCEEKDIFELVGVDG